MMCRSSSSIVTPRDLALREADLASKPIPPCQRRSSARRLDSLLDRIDCYLGMFALPTSPEWVAPCMTR